MPRTVQPSREACEQLLRAAPAISAFRRELYRAAPAEARGWLGAISVVTRHPEGLRPSKVAELLHLDLSVVSRNLSQLEELGYVRRAPDPDDGRASIVQPTAEGIAWVDRFADQFAEQLASTLAGWTDRDVDSLTQMLQRFGATIESTNTSSPDGAAAQGLA
ncbi:MAG: MarR family transcriptional regulator [Gaiellales bacterium]